MGFEDLLKEVFGGLGGEGQRGQPSPRSGPQPLPEPAEEGSFSRLVRGVVQVVALRQGFLGGMSSTWTGSGTIIDPSGIVLTNCHVASPRDMGMSAPPADRLAIAMTERSDHPPAVSYFAEVAAIAPRLDLAVLRIIADVRGRPIRDLNLPFVEIGNSDSLQLGDRISIFGFPGIGGETVTYTAGNVSGFTGEPGVAQVRAWIKTDATIAGGNSGGTAVNDEGQLIGIPTQAAAGTGVNPVDARPVLDTNRDGRIDERDTPMAVGGFINGLRPVNLAFPLLEKIGLRIDAKGGAQRTRPMPEPSTPPQPRADRPRFSELLFSTQVTDDGRPINPASMVPAGIESVYATFEYDGMTPGTLWSVVWLSNGQQIIDQKNTWNEGPQGRKAVKVSNRKGLPEGEYHLVLGIGGKVELEGKVMVGNPIDETDSQVSGRLVDDATRQGIADAAVMVLQANASLQRFLRTQDKSMVFAMAQTSGDGRFTFDKQLPKGQAYSLVALAKNYRLLAVDGALRVSSRAPETADIGEVEMSREQARPSWLPG